MVLISSLCSGIPKETQPADVQQDTVPATESQIEASRSRTPSTPQSASPAPSSVSIPAPGGVPKAP